MHCIIINIGVDYLFTTCLGPTTSYQHYKRFIALAVPLISMASVVQVMVVSFYMCQPNHSYSHFMFSLYSDLTRANVVTDALHCVWSELPHQGNTALFMYLYLYSICLVSITCCDATITNISAILTYRSYVLFLIHF